MLWYVQKQIGVKFCQYGKNSDQTKNVGENKILWDSSFAI